MRRTLTALPLIALTVAPAHADGMPTPVAELERGATVTVAGIVERITDEDEFRLADPSGTVRVYVGPDRVPAIEGEAVLVEGRVDDDPGPLEIYARSLTRADGTVILFDALSE